MLLVCNDPFLTPVLFVCAQLRKHQKRDFDIAVVSGENLGRKIPDGIQFLHIDMDSFTNHLPEISRLGKYTYWRIPAIEKLSERYKRILYLDADIYINDGTLITDLFSITMDDHSIAAVLDVHQHIRATRVANEHKSLNIKEIPYFNAGLLLIDSISWRKNAIFSKILYLTNKHKKLLSRHDQSLLNLATEGQWLELAPTWNWQYSYKNCFITEMISPQIIHFAGAVKLWDRPNGMIPKRYWSAYQDYLASIGIKTPYSFPPTTKSLLGNWKSHLLKNMWYFNGYCRYLDRFPSTLTTFPHSKRFELTSLEE